MNWKKELELLKEKQGKDGYGLMICEDAKAVMELIGKQGHSGMSFSFLASILIRLLNEKPLFPITDDPSEWGTEADSYPGNDSIQNNRCYGIFKHKNGTITDNNRVVFVNNYDNENSTWHKGDASIIIDKMFPITLPYMPADKPYYVYGKDMYLDKDGNDVTKDHVGSYNYTILEYIVTPEGERIELNKHIDYREKEEKN